MELGDKIKSSYFGARMSPASLPTQAAAQPGDLLHELDDRQNEVLEQLDELQARLDGVFAELGITPLTACAASSAEAVD